MSTQQDIYATGSENHPPMLNKENYVPWSSRLLWYAKSRPNGKLIHNSIINGLYVRRMIPEPGDPNRKVHVNETFHVQTDDELTEKELKQIEADDQAIQTILLGLLEDIYAAVNSCETAQKICLQWTRHVTIVHQTKDLHTADYTQLYDFLKYNQKEIAQPGMNMGQERQMQMVGGNQVIHNVVQNPRIQMVGNQNGLIGIPGNGNQNPNGNGNLVTARAEESSKFLWCSSTLASLFFLRLLLDAEGTLSFFVLLLGCGLLVLVLSTPVEDKPFESELTSFLVKTGGCETVIVVSSFDDSLEQVAVSLLNHAQQEDHAFQITLFHHINSVVSSELA
uniref:Uncharacterized protein n=1 Tax=Tanacetum cinerariifolium TaxID=118510 RepID=A0A6L2MH90_TANCI|nr:hypothetical protein [Tanacetum cinerariifolium]